MRKTKAIAKLHKRELKELAKGDQKGEKFHRNNLEEVIKTFREKVTNCSICQDTPIKPVTLPCQHSFCVHCFEEAALLCKQPITISETRIDRSIQQLILSAVPCMPAPQKDEYLKRLKETENREKQRLVDCSRLKPGDEIDYRQSSSLRWRKGTVMEVQKADQHFLVYVEFQPGHKNEQSFQIFESYSRSLATPGFFSTRSHSLTRVLKRQKLSDGMINRIALSQHHKAILAVLNPK